LCYKAVDPGDWCVAEVLIIAVCSVVGVLVLAGIMVAVVVKHRQLRARYANHQPLATEDFRDDDDEPLVI
jgi:hypothetical protein